MKVKLAASALMAVLVLALTLLVGSPVQGQGEEESFWRMVRRSYVEWDDNAKTGKATEVAGVRGLDVEKKLGDKGYDWAAVKAMEDYQLDLEAQKRFLQIYRLGPYQGK